jgi:hypothetical protein
MGATCIFMKRESIRTAWVTGSPSRHFDDDDAGTGVAHAEAAGHDWAALTVDHHIYRIMVDKA